MSAEQIRPEADPTNTRLDQDLCDHRGLAVESGQTTPEAVDDATPMVQLPPGSQTARSTIQDPTPSSIASTGHQTALPTIQDPAPSHHPSAEPPTAPPTTVDTAPTLRPSAEHPTSSTPASRPTTSNTDMPVVDDLLFIHATAHHDLEQQRIASQHRLRILTTTEADEDGIVRGFGLDERHPDVARLAGITDALATIEHGAELNLKRAMRGCAIYPWVKAQIGLGDKQVARLLGAIGDPYWHRAADRPRTVSELWAYCGLHVLPASHATTDTHGSGAGGAQTSDPGHIRADAHAHLAGVAARRTKGQKANWSTDAKTRAYLIATSCIKQARSPYRATYDQRRAHTAVTHPEWTPGHSHNDALRVSSKAILRDLWRESKRLHEEGHR